MNRADGLDGRKMSFHTGSRRSQPPLALSVPLSRFTSRVGGGESGPGARPMGIRWVRDIRAQCSRAGVAFFFKQWGGVRKSKTGRVLDGRTHDEFPERRQVPVPDLGSRRSALERLEAELV